MAREVTNIFASLRQNIIGGVMISAFGQVAKSKEISHYLYRGGDFSNSMRHDIQAHYSGSLIQTGKYAEDGLDILIKNKWFEQPPIVIESRELVKA